MSEKYVIPPFVFLNPQPEPPFPFWSRIWWDPPPDWWRFLKEEQQMKAVPSIVKYQQLVAQAQLEFLNKVGQARVELGKELSGMFGR